MGVLLLSSVSVTVSAESEDCSSLQYMEVKRHIGTVDETPAFVFARWSTTDAVSHSFRRRTTVSGQGVLSVRKCFVMELSEYIQACVQVLRGIHVIDPSSDRIRWLLWRFYLNRFIEIFRHTS